LKIGSLESEEIIIGCLESEEIIIGCLESEKIGSLQIHTGYLTFSFKNPDYTYTFLNAGKFHGGKLLN